MSSSGLEAESAYDVADQEAFRRLAGNGEAGEPHGPPQPRPPPHRHELQRHVGQYCQVPRGGYRRVQANGTFIVLDVSMTNEKNKPATILPTRCG